MSDPNVSSWYPVRRWQTWRNGYVGRLVVESFRTQGHLYAIGIVGMVFMAASAGATAWVMERIIDVMTTPDNRSAVFAVAGTVILIFVVRGVAGYVQAVFMARAGNRIVALSQGRLYRRLLDRGVGFYRVTESSDLLMRVTQSAQMARMLIDILVTGFIRDFLTMVFLFAVMFYQQPTLSLICVIAGPLAIIAVRYLLRQVRAIMEQNMASLAEIFKVMQETSGGIEVIKVFRLENRLIDRMEGAILQVEARSNAIVRLQALTNPVMDFLAGCAIAGVVVVSALGLGGEPATPGQLMSFVTALLMTYEPGKRISRMRVQIEAQMVGVRMMFDLLDEEEIVMEAEDAKELKPGKGRVEFKEVSYSYRKDLPVINDMSMVFEAGKTAALVGQSGGGKSTIAALVMRFFDPDQGSVLINGQDIRDVTFASLRDKISYVGQDTFLFATTVMENLRCSKPDASDDEVVAAAEAANAHEFIVKLPQGYDTMVGENGTFLSGGQKQRLAIGRAILRESEILLLDEATSALDTESEALVKNALRRVSEGRTTIVIAHRLSTVMEADQIFVIQDGQIAEQGDPQTLLERDEGAFRNLFEHQFKSEKDPDSDQNGPELQT
ncbi:MAG: ABC transporter ATP-binding protein [Paracoccaceae bacterium]